jgi:hypothetical protein
VTKYRTTFFRHDDWYLLCKPVLEELTLTLYEKVSQVSMMCRKKEPWHLTVSCQERQRGLERASMPHATLRLLPKAKGVRPIANLGRKTRKVRATTPRCPVTSEPVTICLTGKLVYWRSHLWQVRERSSGWSLPCS